MGLFVSWGRLAFLFAAECFGSAPRARLAPRVFLQECISMASGTCNSKHSRTTTSQQQKSLEHVAKACKENDDKMKSLMDQLATEKKQLTALNKLVQMHQGALNVTSSDVFKSQLVTWLGAPPSTDSVEALTKQLHLDLSVSDTFAGCSISECKAVIVDASKDVIRRLYEATLQVQTYKIQLSVESKQQVLTGNEAVCAVKQVVFAPTLPQMEPLRKQVVTSCCLYIIPPALRRLQELEEEQRKVLVWCQDVANLEIVSLTLRLVLGYVPLRTSVEHTPPPVAKKRGKARISAPSRGKKNRPVRQEQRSPEDNPESSENDLSITLGWDIAYCCDIRNFQSCFKLDVTQSVLELYSTSPVQPLLSGAQPLASGSDVIKLFSALTH